MNIVVDANIVAGYFKEEIAGKKCDLTKLPAHIFENAGTDFHIFLDDEGHIENEWKELVDREWFKAWLEELFDRDAVIQISTETYYHMKEALRKMGFPNSKDLWYARVAKSISEIHGISGLISEDLDFYEPSKKKILKGKARKSFILKRKGSVAKYLCKKQSINVTCVYNF